MNLKKFVTLDAKSLLTIFSLRLFLLSNYFSKKANFWATFLDYLAAPNFNKTTYFYISVTRCG